MQKVVGVKFSSSSKIYNFLPNGETFSIGDEVVVETQNGISVGTVAVSEFEAESKKNEEPQKPIIRRATERDIQKKIENQKRGKEALPRVEGLVKRLGLIMKIVDVEYAFDDSKVTISFTADGRVDFRELLRELASTLRSRIELRQIGSRDEVKAIGGIGPCGLECCCKRFGGDVEHVSVKMAKNQGLSLSPTKINGLCGRLMCCLAYENEVYQEILSRMPKVGSRVKTPDGEGVVTFNDILKQKVTVKVFGKDDSFDINTYELDKIEISEKNEKIERCCEKQKK